ncbi:hypothetical protein [Mycobacterium marinum]|uniref:hypothetical protein n=1 Tax=Mycobacterium marinum TaxID=1781 RepID=UPI0035614D9A
MVALAQYANKLIKRIGCGFTNYRIRALLDADKANRPGLTSIVVRWTPMKMAPGVSSEGHFRW